MVLVCRTLPEEGHCSGFEEGQCCCQRTDVLDLKKDKHIGVEEDNCLGSEEGHASWF